VVLAQLLAKESSFITAEAVEAMEFQALSDQFAVSGVPHTVINSGAGNVVGAVPENVLIDHIKQALLGMEG
jgi:thioredoxin-related protein